MRSISSVIRTVIGAGAAALAISGAASAQEGRTPYCDLQATALYTSKVVNYANVPYTPAIGESYRVTLDYKVVKATAQPFKIRFKLAGRETDVSVGTKPPGTYSASCSFKLPLDESIPFSAYLDPLHTGGEAPETGWFAYFNNFKLSSVNYQLN